MAIKLIEKKSNGDIQVMNRSFFHNILTSVSSATKNVVSEPKAISCAGKAFEYLA